MANKWRDLPIYERTTPFIRHFHGVFDAPVLNLNLSINSVRRKAIVYNSYVGTSNIITLFSSNTINNRLRYTPILAYGHG